MDSLGVGVGHEPQSPGQVEHFSFPLQLKSPQKGLWWTVKLNEALAFVTLSETVMIMVCRPIWEEVGVKLINPVLSMLNKLALS